MPCLDTNVLIDLSRPNSRHFASSWKLVRRYLDAGQLICTTRLNEAEFLVGVERSTNPERNRAKFQRLLSAMAMLELTEDAARRFGKVQAHLLQIGRPSGEMDVLIAAVALAHGQSLITRNPRHFADIAGLVVESY